jgi:hypothetical protein
MCLSARRSVDGLRRLGFLREAGSIVPAHRYVGLRPDCGWAPPSGFSRRGGVHRTCTPVRRTPSQRLFADDGARLRMGSAIWVFSKRRGPSYLHTGTSDSVPKIVRGRRSPTADGLRHPSATDEAGSIVPAHRYVGLRPKDCSRTTEPDCGWAPPSRFSQRGGVHLTCANGSDRQECLSHESWIGRRSRALRDSSHHHQRKVVGRGFVADEVLDILEDHVLQFGGGFR